MNDAVKENQIPEFSIAEDNGQLIIRVDSGRFMDTVFWFVETDAGLRYNFSAFVSNGVQRDPAFESTETFQEFTNKVAIPIMTGLQKLYTMEPDQNVKPSIILPS